VKLHGRMHDPARLTHEARRTRELRWTDPRSEWMAHRVTVEIADDGVGVAWSRQTAKHRRAA
jgi:hypothetical protein